MALVGELSAFQGTDETIPWRVIVVQIARLNTAARADQIKPALTGETPARWSPPRL